MYEKKNIFFPKSKNIFEYLSLFFLQDLLRQLKQLSNRCFQNLSLLLKIAFVFLFSPRKKKHYDLLRKNGKQNVPEKNELFTLCYEYSLLKNKKQHIQEPMMKIVSR